eukprot:5303571-Alexandrium_andersonii.AAC.1
MNLTPHAARAGRGVAHLARRLLEGHALPLAPDASRGAGSPWHPECWSAGSHGGCSPPPGRA